MFLESKCLSLRIQLKVIYNVIGRNPRGQISTTSQSIYNRGGGGGGGNKLLQRVTRGTGSVTKGQNNSLYLFPLNILHFEIKL